MANEKSIRTINGKSFEEIIKALREPFRDEDVHYNQFGFPFFPEEKVRQRMNEVVGEFNYDFTISSPAIANIGTRHHIYLSGCLTIRDDNGEIITQKSACGGAPVIIANVGQEVVAIKNDMESASNDVFKRCCKKLGVGEEQLRSARGNGKKSDAGDPSGPLMLYRVTLKEAFSTVGKGNTLGYGAMVDIEGESEPRKLMIWKEGQQAIEKYMTMSVFIQKYKAGKSFRLYGYKSTFKKKDKTEQLQLILEKPYTENEEG